MISTATDLQAAYNAATVAAKGVVEGTKCAPAPFESVSVTVEDECRPVRICRASEIDDEHIEDQSTGYTIAAFNFGPDISREAVCKLADSLAFGYHALEGNILVIDARHLGKPWDWRPALTLDTNYDPFSSSEVVA